MITIIVPDAHSFLEQGASCPDAIAERLYDGSHDGHAAV